MSGIDELERFVAQRDWPRALEQFDRLTAKDQSHLRAKYNRAIALLELGHVGDAREAFRKMTVEHPSSMSVLFMRGKASLSAGAIDEGLRDLDIVWSKRRDELTLRLLAGVHWMRSDYDAFYGKLSEAVRSPELAAIAADILREVGFLDEALQYLERAADTIQRDSIEAHIHVDRDDGVAAEAAARRVLQKQPGYPPAMVHFIVSLLLQGKVEQAQEAIGYARAADPYGQRWLADEAVVFRLVNDPQFNEFYDPNQLVGVYQLAAPPGYASIEKFNEALAQAVEKYQKYTAHPIGQSLRTGSQTIVELSQLEDPVIKAYFAALDGPIREYLNKIGADEAHPLARRNTGNYRIAGSWSVKLRGGGRHVNHFHPEGWISSSYYVSVPDETTDTARRAGWIKFGEPPYKTSPPSPPLKWVQPKAGMLVLFPSYLWHGTEPIDEGSTRITAPFDIVPA